MPVSRRSNYPAPFLGTVFAASGQSIEDCLEGICSLESCGVDGGSDVRLGLRGPHGAIAIGDFSLDHAGPQLSLRAIIGGVDVAGIIAKGKKLVLRAPDFGLELARQVALRRRAENIGELPFKRALFAGDGRCGEVGDVRGQIERLAKPQLEPQGQIVRSMLQRKSRIARQMGETSLMRGAMLLLRGLTIRNPDLRLMSAHRLFHDAGAARIIGLMHDRILAVKQPCMDAPVRARSFSTV